MKHIKNRWLGLAFAPALFALIGFASPAQAADYSVTCANISQFNGTGNVSINNTGACSLPSAVTATGFIRINSSGAITAQALSAGTDLTLFAASGNVSTQALTSGGANYLTVNALNGNVSTGVISAGSHVWMIADNGTILVTGNLTSNVGGLNGNVLLQAGSTIRAGAISTIGGSSTGGVQIDANRNGGNTLFRIGNNATNGVTSINTSNTTAGGTNPNFITVTVQ